MVISVPVGPATVLTQNVVYALPTMSSVIQSTAALESAILEAGPFTAFTTSIVTGAFVRCTTASPTVKIKHNTAG